MVAREFPEIIRETPVPTGPKGEKRPADVIGNLAAIRATLEAAGVVFIAENGGGGREAAEGRYMNGWSREEAISMQRRHILEGEHLVPRIIDQRNMA